MIPIETQTDMTLSRIESLENNLNNARTEKNKYMMAVKNIKSKGISPNDLEVVSQNISEVSEVDDEESEVNPERIKELKEDIRQQVFKKKIEIEKKKSKKDKYAYVSLDQYKTKIFADNDVCHSPERRGSISPIGNGIETPLNLNSQNILGAKLGYTDQKLQNGVIGQTVGGEIFQVNYQIQNYYYIPYHIFNMQKHKVVFSLILSL
jgi:hypothetical protein